MKNWIITTFILLLAQLLPASNAANVPFRLPSSASITHEEKDGQGWKQEGVIADSMQAAKRQMISALTSSHWRLEKAIPLRNPNERILYQWAKGRQRMLLMMWRIDEKKKTQKERQAGNGCRKRV